MNKHVQSQMVLHDDLWLVMIKLSWPAVIAMVLYGLNTVFDALFVGRFVGETALAGVSLAYPLTQLSLGLGQLIGVGAGSALSIAIGAKDLQTQQRILGNVNYLNVLIGVLITLSGVAFSSPLIRMMGGNGKELMYGTEYFRITQYASIFWIAGLAGNMIVRAEGKMGSAALMMGLGLLVNVCCNYLFIVLLGWGVRGAAWGTNMAMLVYTLSFIIYASSSRISFQAKVFSLRRDKTIIASIFSMGFPSLIMAVMSLVQGIVVLNAISRYGTTADIAFFGIVYRLFLFVLTPIFGLMRALQPAVGINYGAGKYLRVISSFRIFGCAASILVLPFWLFMMMRPEAVILLMLPTAVLTVQDISNFRVYMSLLPLMPVIFMAMTFFPAINNGKPAAVMGITRQLVFYVPLMLILPRYFGVSWVYTGSVAIDLVMVLWVFFMVSREFSLLRKRGAEADATAAFTAV